MNELVVHGLIFIGVIYIVMAVFCLCMLVLNTEAFEHYIPTEIRRDDDHSRILQLWYPVAALLWPVIFVALCIGMLGGVIAYMFVLTPWKAIRRRTRRGKSRHARRHHAERTRRAEFGPERTCESFRKYESSSTIKLADIGPERTCESFRKYNSSSTPKLDEIREIELLTPPGRAILAPLQ